MWVVIGALVLIGIGWLALNNRSGGNSPADWYQDYKDELADDARDLTRTAREHMADYWKYDED